jgi:tetratricopeptide (TPR) repeat protein
VPDFVGSTPILLSGKLTALKMKGYTVYLDGAKNTDRSVRDAKYKEANALYDEALSAFDNAMDILKKAAPATDPIDQKRRELLTLNLYTTAVEVHRLKSATKMDTPRSAEASTVIPAYIALETDPAKKLKAQMTLGDIMRGSSDFERAVAAYREILATNPDNAEATGKLGLSLFAQGAATDPEDKEKEQEGLNYMQKFTEMAPVAATDSAADKELKTSIKEAVDYLKSLKMAPQKPASTKKRGG